MVCFALCYLVSELFQLVGFEWDDTLGKSNE